MSKFRGYKVMVYQKFSDTVGHPFEAKILDESSSHWKLVYKDSKGNPVQRVVLKACCSTDPYKLKKAKKNETKTNQKSKDSD